ncbi:MAG TPA: STAS domain-containing protein [Streptosporangiaceae bacterium]
MASLRARFLLPVQHLDGSAAAALPTEIDFVNAAAVSDALLALLDQGASGLVVDMTGTRFCDVAGVRAIVRAHCHAQSMGGWVRVVAPDHCVRRIFALTGAEDIVMLYPDLDAALLRPAARPGRPAPQTAEIDVS